MAGKDYDKDTLAYLEAAGVQGELLDRVRRLAQDAASGKSRPIAGTDIRVGTTVSLKPGDKPFTVTRIDESEVSDNLVFLYDGDKRVADGAIFTNRWYAEVVSP